MASAAACVTPRHQAVSITQMPSVTVPLTSRAESDDADLVRRIVTGDIAAAKNLYVRYAERLYCLIFRIVGDEEPAKDCLQDTFIRAFEHLAEWRGGSLEGWLRRIAVSVSLNQLRRVRRRREIRLDEPGAASLPAGATGAASELRGALRRAIDALPRRHRAVFLLREIEGYGHQEIAAMLRISEGASRVLLNRARGRLRRALAPWYEGPRQ